LSDLSSRPSPQDSADDDDDDEFVYPTSTTEPEFVYPASHPQEIPSAPPVQHPSPAQLESIYAAASSGDLPLLKRLFRNALESGNVEPFSLSNDASPRTGFTALHAAAGRGYLDIVIWCIESGYAMPDLEDKEGETALHKAALNGHLPIVKYLLPAKADVNARDADGWTALHNACSKVAQPMTQLREFTFKRVIWILSGGSVKAAVRLKNTMACEAWMLGARAAGHLSVRRTRDL
jgi:hypothetical protein